MTLSYFNDLCGEDQEDEIFKNGVWIGTREDEKYEIYLYQLPNFYAEIFHRKDDDYPEKIKSFDGVAELDAYTGQINIDELR